MNMRESSSSLLHPLIFWLICHLRAFIMGLGAVIKKPFSSVLSILVIGIALSLPSGFLLLYANAKVLTTQFHPVPTLSLYLNVGTSTQQSQAMVERLEKRQDLQHIQYISPREGLNTFSENIQLKNLVDSIKKNPLPGIIQIEPKREFQNPMHLAKLEKDLSAWRHVEVSQLDMNWVTRLYNVLILTQRLIYALLFLFTLGVLLIIGNTIRLITQSHIEEISVLELFGATPAFIRRPILYRGMLYGFFGGLLACIILMIIGLTLKQPAQSLLLSYTSNISLIGLSLGWALILCFFSALLGYFGARIAVQAYVH